VLEEFDDDDPGGGVMAMGPPQTINTSIAIRTPHFVIQASTPHVFDGIQFQNAGLPVQASSADPRQVPWMETSSRPIDRPQGYKVCAFSVDVQRGDDSMLWTCS